MSRKSKSPIRSPAKRPATAAPATGHAFEQALALCRQGLFMQAEVLCGQIAQADPGHFLALNLLGVIALQTGRPALAVAHFDRVIAVKPDFVEAHNTRGGVLYRLGQFEAALASFDRVVAIDPRFAPAWSGRGSTLVRLGRLQAALESFGKAAELAPAHAETHYNVGCVLNDLKQYEAAVASFDKATALNPQHAEAHNNKGVALAALKRFEAALASHDEAIRLKPALADNQVNRGITLELLGRHEAAKHCYEAAVAVAPDHARARWNLALCCLLTGDFAAGWENFEWRWKYRGLAESGFAQPRWSGAQSLQDKTILLYAEQGLGDTLQFCRYAESVAKLGARVILRVPRPLVALCRSLAGVAEVIAEDAALPVFDFQCPLMSLPLAFKTRPDTIPSNVPYLFAAADKHAAWQARLADRPGLRVGLVWSGGFRSDQPETWEINRRRNIPLAELAALDVPGVSFFSLQKGDDAVAQLRELEAASRGPSITDYTEELADFSDTAAFIDNLDLIISVDTSTAHLAGAMGKEVWLLNRFDTCWRWLLDRADSPWYPGVTLFRQPQPGDWDSVMAAVHEALRKRAATL